MKPLIFSFLQTLVTLTVFGQAPVGIHGSLHVEKTRLTDEHGKVVVLRGMSFGWHNFHPRFYNTGAVRWLHEDWGCTVVRASMGETGILIRQYLRKYVQEK